MKVISNGDVVCFLGGRKRIFKYYLAVICWCLCNCDPQTFRYVDGHYETYSSNKKIDINASFEQHNCAVGVVLTILRLWVLRMKFVI
jgi:hypothetical protein